MLLRKGFKKNEKIKADNCNINGNDSGSTDCGKAGKGSCCG